MQGKKTDENTPILWLTYYYNFCKLTIRINKNKQTKKKA